MKIAFVVGARPNYMKVAPILKELARRRAVGERTIEPLLVHTGQHYDDAMSDSFFRDLGMPKPNEFLNVGSDSHAKQTAKIMSAFDEVCDRHLLGAVVVVGDVNSTVACALVASKRNIDVVHVEAGLRSYDRSMPEEINRILTDQISDLLLVTSEDAIANLEREGIARDKIRFVGNPMIDSLDAALSSVRSASLAVGSTGSLTGRYALVTLHRPGNVDDEGELNAILDGLRRIADEAAVVFPVHPRTSKRLTELGVMLQPFDREAKRGMFGLPPLPYIEFLSLMRNATIVLTDSGGVQEETTVLGVPCATLRPNTERPVTVTMGTNELVARDAEAIFAAYRSAAEGRWKKGSRPPLWDGHAAPRICDELATLLSRR